MTSLIQWAKSLFRPLWLVVAYFVVVLAYGLSFGDHDDGTYVTLSQFHEAIGVLAGLSFAFSNEDADKGAMVILAVYAVVLAAVDWALPEVGGRWIAFVAACAIGWVFWVRREAARRAGEKASG